MGVNVKSNGMIARARNEEDEKRLFSRMSENVDEPVDDCMYARSEIEIMKSRPLEGCGGEAV